MATQTLGTNTNSSLDPAIVFKPGYGSGMSAADIASVAQSIKDDLNTTHPIYPQAFSSNGLLYVPNRGILTMLPGDVVAVDSTGWPVLVSSNAIANGPWTLT